MSNLALIQPQRVDFDTQATCDWLDTLPLIGTASFGGVIAGYANVGNGSLAVASVAAGTAYGVVVATIASVSGGVTRLSVADATGGLLAQGVVGLALFAGGITFTITQGSTPFAVGDSFAIGVVPAPLDLTGVRFDLDARVALGAATTAIRASTADNVPTIIGGGASGVLAMRVLKATMAICPVKPDGYPYSILATDTVSNLTVPAFYGLIHHVAVAAQIGV